LGNPLVRGGDTKGMGLGTYIIIDAVRRAGGEVQVATSTVPVGRFPAGTVVSLRLPKTEQARHATEETDEPCFVILRDYAAHRAQIEPDTH
jgi:signal transduction histidine kinase